MALKTLKHIRNWKAKRSGGKITITGIAVDSAGNEQSTRITGIDEIDYTKGSAAGVAKHCNGRDTYPLA